MAKRFQGQNIVILGSATGLGLAMAEQFAREGASLVLGDVDPRLDQAVASCRALGARAEGIRTDVSQDADVAALADFALTTLGRIDIVCSNAGVNECPGLAWELEPNDWTWVLGVNLIGLGNVVRNFVPLMIAQESGHLVSTASNTSLVTASGVGAYVASKKGNLGLCEVLQMDLQQAGHPIDVSVICPGKIMSDMPDSARSRPAALSGRVPTAEDVAVMKSWLGVGGMTPEQVAAAAIDGIAERRFYILTHEGDLDEVERWMDGVRQGRLGEFGMRSPEMVGEAAPDKSQ